MMINSFLQLAVVSLAVASIVTADLAFGEDQTKMKNQKAGAGELLLFCEYIYIYIVVSSCLL